MPEVTEVKRGERRSRLKFRYLASPITAVKGQTHLLMAGRRAGFPTPFLTHPHMSEESKESETKQLMTASRSSAFEGTPQ